MLERVWSKGNPLVLLVGMQIDTATMEDSMEKTNYLGHRTKSVLSKGALKTILRTILEV